MRIPALPMGVRRGIGFALVALFALGAQVEVWLADVVDGSVLGPRLLNAVLLALVCVPLLWRRSHRPISVTTMAPTRTLGWFS